MEIKSRHFHKVTKRGAGGMEHVQSGRIGEQPCGWRSGQTNTEDEMGGHVESGD